MAGHGETRFVRSLKGLYRRLLPPLLVRPGLLIAALSAVFVVTGMSVTRLGEEFLPHFQEYDFLMASGDYAWAGTSDSLRKIHMTGALAGTYADATNYLASANLLSVSGMALSPTGDVLISGTGSSGATSTVLVNAQTGEISATSNDASRVIVLRAIAE